MQTLLLIFILISGAILNASGKPFPPTDLSNNSQPTNATKQEVLELYVFDIADSSYKNESLMNSSSQNETANNIEIIIEKDIIERESSQDKDLQPIDNEGKKRDKRCLEDIIRAIIGYEPQRQPTYITVYVGGSGNINNVNIDGQQYDLNQGYYIIDGQQYDLNQGYYITY